jgi:hypothetical protein
MFLKDRLATDAETRYYYRRKSEIHDEGKRLGLSGKELFAFTTAESRKLHLHYSAALDSVVYEPTPDEVFDAFCKEHKVEIFDRPEARRIWDLALQYAHEPRFEPELMEQLRAGARKIKQMKPDEIMFLRDRHRQRYS